MCTKPNASGCARTKNWNETPFAMDVFSDDDGGGEGGVCDWANDAGDDLDDAYPKYIRNIVYTP